LFLVFAAAGDFCYVAFMEKDMRLLQREAEALGLRLDETALDRFGRYAAELRSWNAKTNLIADSTIKHIVTRHFLDSLTAAPFISPPYASVVDIGTGAGFPGIPLAIAMPSIHLTLIEANRKKVSFLKHIRRVLNMSDITVIQNRAEELIMHPESQKRHDVVISRAAFKLPELVSMSLSFLAPKGLLIAMKSADIEDELALVQHHLPANKNCQINQYDIKNPLLEAARKIIVFHMS